MSSCVSWHWPDTNCQWPSDPVLSAYETPQFLHSAWQNFAAVLMTLLILVKVVIWYAGCRQLLEILEISLNLYGPPGNFCVKCRWLTALVSSHDKTWYRIAYLRNWSPFFIFATPPCCAYPVFVLYLGKLVDSVHCVAGWSNANMSRIFLEIPPGISWKFVQLNL